MNKDTYDTAKELVSTIDDLTELSNVISYSANRPNTDIEICVTSTNVSSTIVKAYIPECLIPGIRQLVANKLEEARCKFKEL